MAFAAFSIVETAYDFATTTLHASLAKQIYIVMPSKETSHAVNTNWIFLQNNILATPDMISHEFGHLVSASGGFEGSSGSAENSHYAEVEQRALPPTTPKAIPPIPQTPPTGAVSSTDLGIAWNEGFADYYAVACKTAISTAGLNITQLATNTANPTLYVGPSTLLGGSYPANVKAGQPNVEGGWGEDNEISVMRILWAYSHGNGYSDSWLYDHLTVLNGWEYPPLSLSDFWNLMQPVTTGPTPAWANQKTAAEGVIFQNAGVSPTVASYTPPANGKTAPFFTFQLPNVNAPIDPTNPGFEPSPTKALTFSNITLSVYNAAAHGGMNTVLLSITATITLVNPNANGGTYQITTGAGVTGTFSPVGTWDRSKWYAVFQYTLSAADWSKIRSTGSTDSQRYCVVSGGSTTSDNNASTGPYWSTR